MVAFASFLNQNQATGTGVNSHPDSACQDSRLPDATREKGSSCDGRSGLESVRLVEIFAL